MKHSSDISGYTVVMALFIMSFLLLMTTGVFRLVVWELTQTRWEESYLKAYAGAESGRELALLHVKENGYGSYDAIAHTLSNRSIVLADNPSNISEFHQTQDVFLSYDLWYRASEHQGLLEPYQYDIIPLYSDEDHLKDMSLELISGVQEGLLWNIISQNSGLAAYGSFDISTRWKSRWIDTNNNIIFGEPSLWEFLWQSDNNYLVLFNASDIDLQYSLVAGSGDVFSLPRTDIISSGQVWKYRQNLRTQLDNTEFLWILRYSVFSPNTLTQ